jgi:hypothetical protein
VLRQEKKIHVIACLKEIQYACKFAPSEKFRAEPTEVGGENREKENSSNSIRDRPDWGFDREITEGKRRY